MYALGIDIGTSGVRTAVLDQGGALVSSARADHLPQSPDSIDATLWWVAVENCLTSQVAALRGQGLDPAGIKAISVDGTSGSMVLTDAGLTPVSPALMYNSKGFDAEAALIANYAPNPHITRGSNSALGRAMRLVSEASDQPAHLLHQADFIIAKLCGKGGHSDYNNALKTGFDPASETWPDWIGALIDTDLLPQVHDVGTNLGSIDPSLADRLGLSQEASVHAGTTDSIAAFLACAPMEPGVAVTSLGSTLAIKILSKTRIDDPEIGLYSHKINDLWLVGGASNTGGAVLLEYFTPQQMAELSPQIDTATSTGLDYYPLKEPGERFPINDPTLAPRLSPRPASDVLFLQALYEAIARIEAQCYSSIHERGGSLPTKVMSAGGGASDERFSSIRAAALGLVPIIPPQTEASIGAAKVALMGAQT